MADRGETARIEIRVDRVTQLFDSLDPSPFSRRDLAGRAHDYIVDSARELPADQRMEIVVHLPAEAAGGMAQDLLATSFRNYFEDRADHAAMELRDLLRVGRLSLAIGLGVLAICFALVIVLQSVASLFWSYWVEGLVILGWVALWRPMEIFLYEWWPILKERNLYRRLAQAEVRVVPAGSA